MEIGILGMERSGKSTLFQILTGVDSSSFFGERFVRGIAKVPDERFDNLVKIFKPAKVTPATIPFIDVNAKGENAWDSIRQSLSSVDGILHIIDAFSKTNFEEIKSEYSKLEDELIFSDLIVIERKLERLEKMQAKLLKAEDEVLLKVLPRAKELLEQGKPLRNLALAESEETALRHFSFWSIRPKLIVLNTSEEEAGLEKEFIEKIGTADPVISICRHPPLQN